MIRQPPTTSATGAGATAAAGAGAGTSTPVRRKPGSAARARDGESPALAGESFEERLEELREVVGLRRGEDADVEDEYEGGGGGDGLSDAASKRRRERDPEAQRRLTPAQLAKQQRLREKREAEAAAERARAAAEAAAPQHAVLQRLMEEMHAVAGYLELARTQIAVERKAARAAQRAAAQQAGGEEEQGKEQSKEGSAGAGKERRERGGREDQSVEEAELERLRHLLRRREPLPDAVKLAVERKNPLFVASDTAGLGHKPNVTLQPVARR